MVNCSFCKKAMVSGTGKLYVKKDAKMYYFCTRKCEKNMLKLGRKPRTTKWTGEHHDIKSGIKK